MSLDTLKTYFHQWKLDEALNYVTPQLLKEEIEAKLIVGKIYIYKGEYNKAFELAQEALENSIFRDDFKHESRAREVIAEALWWFGDNNQLENFLNTSENRLKENEELIESDVKITWEGSITNIKGLLAWRRGELEKALDYLQKSKTISEKLGKKEYTATTLFIIGLVYQAQGKNTQSIQALKAGLELVRETDFQPGLIWISHALGYSLYIKGELQEALNYFELSLETHEKFSNQQFMAYSYDNIGLVHHSMGNFETAQEFFERALKLRRNIGNDFETSGTLYHLVLNSMKIKGEDEITESYHNELKLMYEINNDNEVIHTRERLTKALILKDKGNMQNLSEAKQILESIVSKKVVNFELSISAIINLCEILFKELRITENTEIINEIDALLSSLQSMAEMQESYTMMIEGLILKAKLAMITNKLEQADVHLQQAKIIAEELEINRLSNKVDEEIIKIRHKIEKWSEVSQKNFSIMERIQESKVIDYLDTISEINLKKVGPKKYSEIMNKSEKSD